MSEILSVKNLSKKYDLFELKNINLSIPRGVIVGFIGENGAGKTTTIKSILNMINVDTGDIKVFGNDYKEKEKDIKEKIGVVLDNSFFSEQLTPSDINKIMKFLYKEWDEKLFIQYLNDFKLPIEKMIKEYSSGMLMKLKITVALSHHPELLILDEPTSGLDPIARSEILDIFLDFIQNENHSIFVSSHITSDLETVADYIVFINKGEIILSEEKDKLLDDYGIVRCTEDEFIKIEKDDYIKYRKNKFDYELLIADRNNFKTKYDVKVIDKPTLDEIMLIYIKGVK
ncbi:MAG TPA: ABC transporter ATP-binding protein [Tenericutes bacterium]|nr:ABC transporter ATP-binding protein [Mycoplasmatota bacterium]